MLNSNTPICGLIRSVLPPQHEIRVLQATTERCGNLAMRLQVSLLCSTIQLSPLSGWPRQITDKPTMQVDLVPMAANFASEMGPCVLIVEPFKHVLLVTAHPQFLALELRAPMGACLGQSVCKCILVNLLG